MTNRYLILEAYRVHDVGDEDHKYIGIQSMIDKAVAEGWQLVGSVQVAMAAIPGEGTSRSFVATMQRNHTGEDNNT